MLFEQAIIVTRPSTTSDSMGGLNEGAATHVYSGFVDVQEVSQQFLRGVGVLTNEGDAIVFLNEALTTVDASTIAVGDELTIVWDRADVLTNANGDPLEDDGGEWLFSGGATTASASVRNLRRLDNHLEVKYL